MLARNVKPVSLEEFETMPKEEHITYELIDGMIMMSPSPSKDHQRIATKLNSVLYYLLDNTKYEPLHECDIKHNNNVLTPDLMVFCNIDDDIPEIVIEILSPSTRRKDLVTKVLKYEEFGVKEYWIIDPKIKTVTVHDLVSGNVELYGIDDTIQSIVVPEIVIKVKDVFTFKNATP